MITCPDCKLSKPDSEFTEHSIKKCGGRCKPCYTKNNRKSRQKTKEKTAQLKESNKKETCDRCEKNKPVNEFARIIESKVCNECVYGENNKKYQKDVNEYNKNNYETKKCSRCKHIKSRTEFLPFTARTSEEKPGTCKKCKGTHNPQSRQKGGKAAKRKQVNNDKFMFLCKGVDPKKITVWCSQCDNWQLMSELSCVEYCKMLCKNCKDKSDNKKDKDEKKKAKQFNQQNTDVKACTVCYSIKLTNRFIDSKNKIANRCDKCKNSKKNVDDCKDCGEYTELQDNGLCKLCNKKGEIIVDDGLTNEQRKQQNAKRKLAETQEEHKDDDSVQVCNNPKCRRVCPIEDFVRDPGYCRKCRLQNNKHKNDEYERNKETGQNTLKEQKRREKFINMIIDLREENENPEIYICGGRDCKDRYRPVDEYKDLDLETMNKCVTCRLNQRKYDKISKEKIRNDPKKWAQVLKNQRDYRIKKPEKNSEYNRRRRVNADTRVKVIKYKAEKRGYEFQLDDEYAMKLCESDCFYCGRCVDENSINGIDRMFNDYGYLYDNCVSCCKQCNFSKGTSTPKTFARRNYHIASMQFPDRLSICKTFNKEFYNDKYKDLDNGNKYIMSMEDFMYKAIVVRNKIFELTEDEYYNLLNGECFYCKQSTFMYHNKISIDRVDSDIGYLWDNCVPCCSCCNYLKNEIYIDKFLKSVLKIAHNFKSIIKDAAQKEAKLRSYTKK